MRRQAGLPSREVRRGRINTNGLQVRGVVIKSYHADADDSEKATSRDAFQGGKVTAVSCDVLTYGAHYRYFLERVPVLQTHHGLNDYSGLWIPRETTVDLAKGAVGLPIGTLQTSQISNPADLDGDHVLISFLENDPDQPFIMGELPHPRTTYRYTAADGEQVRSRFRGVETRIDGVGGITLDATRANGGEIDANGEETPADDAFYGNLSVFLNSTATLLLKGIDSGFTVEKYRLQLQDGLAKLGLGDGTEINVKPGEVNLGSEAASDFVALATKVFTELSAIVSQTNAAVAALNAVVALLNAEPLLSGVYLPAAPLSTASSVAASIVRAD